MQIIHNKDDIKKIRQKHFDKKIGFVPTMGCLHLGHLSIVEKSKIESDITIVSIFINEKQFSEGEDFDKYPKNHEQDINLLKEKNVDYLYIPNSQEMYKNNHSTFIQIKTDDIQVMCGKSRANFFGGILLVITKLLHQVQPDYLFLGEKDFQQFFLIRKMIQELDFNTKAFLCPTVREKNGLAMSSRNNYLNSKELEKASMLYNSLLIAKEKIIQNESCYQDIINEQIKILEQNKFIIDYYELRNQNNLKIVNNISEYIDSRLFVAVNFNNKCRLIDNIKL